MNKELIRTLVRGAYDVQKLRIQTGNRVVANFKAKLGVKPSQAEEEGLDEEGATLLKTLRLEYERLSDAFTMTKRKAKFTSEGIISDLTEYNLVENYINLEGVERDHFKNLGSMLEAIPLYKIFLEPIKGIGPAMAGVILSEIDISKARYVSSLWMLAGLDTVRNPETGIYEGRSRRMAHRVPKSYTSRDGESIETVGISFNPFLKTKLVGVLGPSFLRVGQSGKYAKIYYDYKHRLENRPEWATRTKAHRHNASIRYMIKLFLQDLYVAWRTLEGLEVHPPYAEQKLGIVHSKPELFS